MMKLVWLYLLYMWKVFQPLQAKFDFMNFFQVSSSAIFGKFNQNHVILLGFDTRKLTFLYFVT